MKHEELTNLIIGAFYKVYNTLGYGFLEKVYENAMCIELLKNNLKIDRQKKVFVYYEGAQVGEFCADLIVEGAIICELKAKEYILDEHEFQLINYLKSTTLEVGLLLNFGKKPEIKRKVYDNNKKTWATTIIHQLE